MANTIKLKRSATPNTPPTTAQLQLGEVAINTYDGKMYIKKNVSGTESIVEVGSGASVDLLNVTTGIASPDYIQFDTGATNTPAVGKIYWDAGEGSFLYTLSGGNVTQNLHPGSELVYNGTGAALTKGQVVYLNGAQGQRPSVALALATSDSTSARTIGIVAETIANGAEGWIRTDGILEGFNTATFTEGAQLYLSGTVAGGMTATKPVAPTHLVYVARCIKSHATAGRILVGIQNGYELDEIHDVLITSPVGDNEVLAYNSATGLWKNETIVSALGYTPANKAGDTFTGAVSFPGGSLISSDGGIRARFNNGNTGAVYFGSGDNYLYYDGTNFSLNGGYLYNASGVHAPAFYDSDNTAYYVNPTAGGTSANLAATVIIGGNYARSLAHQGFLDGQYGTVSSNSTVNPIYCISGGFAPSSATNLGNMYGIGYADAGSAAVWSGGGSWGMYVSAAGVTRIFLDAINGVGNATGSFRAPVFYDSNDTGYYVDPASTSNLSQINFGDSSKFIRGGASGQIILGAGSANDAYIQVGGSYYPIWNSGNFTPGNYMPISGGTFTGAVGFAGNVYNTVGGAKFFANSGNINYLYAATSGLYVQNATDTANILSLTNGGSLTAGADMRAPIFYDSDNTGYYVNPSAGNLSMLIAGRIEGGFGAYSTSGTLDWNDVSNTRSGSTGTLLLGTATNGPGPSIYFHPFNFEYNSKDGNGNVTQMAIAYGSPGNKLYMRGRYSGSWGSWVQFLDTGGDAQYKSGYLESGSSLRAPIFYDSSDTGYYLDPNSTNNAALRIRGGALHGPNPTWGAYLIVGSDGHTGGSYGSVCVTNGNLHLDAVSGYNMYLNNYAGNDTYIRYAGGDRLAIYGPGNYTEATGSLRAPLFYDSNDTSYYVNPNATSITNVFGAYRFKNNSSVSNDDRFGLYFSEDLNEHYAISREAGAWTSPYPDLRIAFYTGMKFMSESVYGGMRFYNDTSYATQIMSISNSGDPLGAGNVYVNNSLQAGSSLRAPIFYDSDDTNYYINPASTSNLTTLTFGTYLKIDKDNNDWASGNYFRGASNHFVLGVQDGGTLYLNYGNSGGTYQIYGTGTHNGYATATSSFRAPIFYDSDNTAYWLDAAGNSVFSAFNVGGGEVYVYGSATNALGIRTGAGGAYKYFDFDASGNFHTQNGSVYSYTFYDKDNTAYYADPTGTSVFNALTVGGSPVMRGVGQAGATNINWNTLGDNQNTIYEITQETFNIGTGSGNSNYPTTASYKYGTLVNFGAVSSARAQMYISHAGNDLIFRGGWGTTSWQTWNKVLTDQNYQTYGNFGSYGVTAAAMTIISTAPSLTLRDSDSDSATSVGYISLQDNGSVERGWMGYGTNGNRNLTLRNTLGIIQLYGSYALSESSHRAPIFYDSDNTGYYVDPNSSSIMYGLRLVSSFDLVTNDVYGSLRVFRNAATSGVLADGMYIGYGNGNGGVTRIYGGGATGGEMIKYSTYTTESGSFRAPIFYDSDNTSYYTDPASTTYINQLQILGGNPVYPAQWTTGYQSSSDFVDGTLVTTDIPATGSDGDSFIIEITGKSYGGVPTKVIAEGYLYNNTIINYAGISYGGAFASYIRVFENSGVLKFWWPRISYWNSFEIRVISMNGPTNNTITRNRVTSITNSTEPSGTKKQTITLATNMRADISATNSVDLRAPIFYDSNNTGHYLDPNSTSNVVQINSNFITLNNDEGLNVKGIRGQFAAGSDGQGIHLFSNVDIGYPSGWGSGLGNTPTRGLSTYGGIRAAYSGTGFILSDTSIRTPIYYDSDNTAYYADPASTSNLSNILIGDSGNGYAYNAAATGKLYFGSIGADAGTHYHITTNMENVGGNYSKLDFKWYTGVRFYAHYAYGGVRFKEITTGNTIFSVGEGDLRVRAYDSMAAPVYYDYDNTAYYFDGAGTSQFNTIETRNGSGLRSFAGSSSSISSQIYFGNADNTRAWNWQVDENNRGALWSYDGSGWSKSLTIAHRGQGVYLRNNSGYDILAFSASNYGYSAAYRTLVIGDQAYTTVCIGVDPSSNPSGSFNGAGSGVEVMFKRGVYFISPNSANNSYDSNLYMGDGYAASPGSLRAPIFYDTNNTGYYVDAAGTSVLAGLTVGGKSWTGAIGTAQNYVPSSTDPANRGNYGAGVWAYSGYSTGTNRPFTYDATLQVMPWDNGGFEISADWIGTVGTQLKVRSLRDCCQGWSTWADVATSSHSFTNTVDLRAPIFYDTDNTGYYFNGSSLTNLVNLTVNGILTVGAANPQYWLAPNSAYQRVDGRNDNTLYARSHWYGVRNDGATSNFRHAWYDGSAYFGIDADSGFINFTRSGGGAVTSDGSFRAPIFYDTNNTAYYTDPASTSNLAGLTVSGTISGNISGYSTYLPTRYDGGQITNPQTYFGQSIGLRVAMTGVPNVWSDTLWINGYSGGDVLSMCALHTSRQGTPRMWISTQQSTATSYGTYYEFPTLGYNSGNTNGLYAGIYYDSSNTGYYIDPASTSVLFNAELLNLRCKFDRSWENYPGIAVYNTTDQGPQADFRIHGLGGANGGDFGVRLLVDGDITALNNLNAGGVTYAQRYYDSNNSGYYVDPTGASSFSGTLTGILQFRCLHGNGVYGGATSNPPLQAYSDDGGAAIMSFHRSNAYAFNMGLDPDNYFRWGGWSAGSNRFVFHMSDGWGQAADSWRAPIFYDSNNTAYYIDPNSTGFSAVLRGYALFGDYGAGIVGSYSSYRYQLVFAMGDSYKGSLDGTSVAGGYGLWYSHPNAGGVAGNLSSHGLMNIVNGAWHASLASSTRAADDMRAPIFYDLNNTGYYFDTNANVGTIYADNWFRSYSASGWYNETYSGGIFMQDTTWVRVYNSKAFYVANEIAATGNITAYYSDERLKTKTGSIDNALDKVSSLEGFLYVENELAHSLGYKNDKQQVGVSAQAVKAVLPEAVSLAPVDFETLEDGTIVSKSGENYLTVDYSRLVPLLIEAIKEQQSQINALESKMEEILAKLK